MTTSFVANHVPTPLSPGSFSSSEPSLTPGTTFSALSAQLGQFTGAAGYGVRYGGGSVAIATGLGLSASGLTATVAAGAGFLGSLVRLTTSASVSLAEDAQNRIWLLPDATLMARTDSVAPSGGGLYLGCVVTGTGAPTIDDSGVMRLRGGLAYRQTNDIGVPEDTPPGDIAFLTLTRAGSFWWNGQFYDTRLAPLVTVNLPDADYTLPESLWANGSWSFRGALTSDREVTLPEIRGGERWVLNFTGVTLTIGGVDVAAGTSARIHFDGTAWV